MPSLITNKFIFLPFNFKRDFRAFRAITKHSVIGHSEEILHSTANFDKPPSPLRSQGFFREEDIAQIKIVWLHKVDNKIRFHLSGFSYVTYEEKKNKRKRKKKTVYWRLTAILLSKSSYESNNNSCYQLRTRTLIFHLTSYVVQNQIWSAPYATA